MEENIITRSHEGTKKNEQENNPQITQIAPDSGPAFLIYNLR